MMEGREERWVGIKVGQKKWLGGRKCTERTRRK